MATNDFSRFDKTFVDETIASGTMRKYTISGTGSNQTIQDTTSYASVSSSQQKKLDASTLNIFRTNLNNLADGKYDFMSLNTSATSGDDKTIYTALVSLGWTDCIE